MNRPAAIVQIDISRPNGEAQAIKDPDLTALLSEGWRVVYGWIKTVAGEPGDSTSTFLMLVLVPPAGELAAPLAEEEREALARVLGAVPKLQQTADRLLGAAIAGCMLLLFLAGASQWTAVRSMFGG